MNVELQQMEDGRGLRAKAMVIVMVSVADTDLVGVWLEREAGHAV